MSANTIQSSRMQPSVVRRRTRCTSGEGMKLWSDWPKAGEKLVSCGCRRTDKDRASRARTRVDGIHAVDGVREGPRPSRSEGARNARSEPGARTLLGGTRGVDSGSSKGQRFRGPRNCVGNRPGCDETQLRRFAGVRRLRAAEDRWVRGAGVSADGIWSGCYVRGCRNSWRLRECRLASPAAPSHHHARASGTRLGTRSARRRRADHTGRTSERFERRPARRSMRP